MGIFRLSPLSVLPASFKIFDNVNGQIFDPTVVVCAFDTITQWLKPIDLSYLVGTGRQNRPPDH